MPAQAPLVLVAGAGRVGMPVAHALLSRGAQVRLLIRAGERDGDAHERIVALQNRGATITEADVTRPDTLPAAVDGVQAVVSTLQGGPEVILDGQAALAKAAKAAGASRFLPSDFAADIFKVPPGRHPLLEMRRAAADAIAASGIDVVHVLNGAFMDVFVTPFAGIFDLHAGTATYWGDADTLLDLTSVADAAAFAAATALDPGLAPGKLEVLGDRISLAEAAAIVGRNTSREITLRRLGSLEELERSIEATAASDPNPWATIGARYLWVSMSGVARLEALQNDRYPEIQPMRFEDFAAMTLGQQRAAAAA